MEESVLITESNKDDFLKRLNNELVYVYPIRVDQSKHYAVNEWSSLHFLFDDNTYYCIAYKHPDAPEFEHDIPTYHKVVTLKKKLFSGSDVIDLATILQLNSVPIPEEREFYTPIIQQIKNQFKFKNLHLSVPLTAWMEMAEKLLHRCRELYTQYKDTENTSEFKFINETTIPTLGHIESSGLWTTDGEFKFSDYNIYTSTGRPSNAFGGINFAALNKNDGSRKQFISRFTDGTLVQFDYEAFHLRLAGNLMGYPLPDTSLHTYLAQQYYGTDEVTEEQYEESKARTFAIMYGQTDDMGDVEFFHKMRDYSYTLWDTYRQNGFVRSQTGRKVIVPEPNRNKVFNYLMQLTETEVALERVNKVIHSLQGRRSCVILFTYDAILLDVPESELELMPTVKSILEDGGYRVREYRGQNYDDLLSYSS